MSSPSPSEAATAKADARRKAKISRADARGPELSGDQLDEIIRTAFPPIRKRRRKAAPTTAAAANAGPPQAEPPIPQAIVRALAKAEMPGPGQASPQSDAVLTRLEQLAELVADLAQNTAAQADTAAQTEAEGAAITAAAEAITAAPENLSVTGEYDQVLKQILDEVVAIRIKGDATASHVEQVMEELTSLQLALQETGAAAAGAQRIVTEWRAGDPQRIAQAAVHAAIAASRATASQEPTTDHSALPLVLFGGALLLLSWALALSLRTGSIYYCTLTLLLANATACAGILLARTRRARRVTA